MGKKTKGGRRQILQLEEKKPPKVPSKSKTKSLIHYSDSDDDSKKSNDSEPSRITGKKESAPLDSQIADFFKEIDALSVPEELLEEKEKSLSPLSATEKEFTSEASILECQSDLSTTTKEDTNLKAEVSPKSKMKSLIHYSDSDDDSKKSNNYCPWQAICDDSTGYSYYWNMLTNEVTWECPSEYAMYVQALGSEQHDKTFQYSQLSELNNEENNKKVKKKKELSQLSEGAIIPISYFGDSSSSDDSCDVENNLNKLHHKTDKMVDPKTNKSIKKVDAKIKAEEKRSTEVIGPQLPPHFQFPQSVPISPEENVEESFPKRENDEFEVKPHLTLKDEINFHVKNSQSTLNDFSAEQSAFETLPKMSVMDTEQTFQDKSDDESSNSAIKKVENLVGQSSYPSTNTSNAFRPVVEYDSFTDEEEAEDLCITKISSKEVSDSELKRDPIQDLEKKVCENEIESLKTLTGTTNEVSKGKRGATKDLEENILKEQFKKPKWSDVDIDSLFTCHLSYGKHGFGFGWQKQLDEENDFHSTSRPDYKTHRGQSDSKTISFVKSEVVLDLKTLHKDLTPIQYNDTLEKETIQENSEYEPFLDQTEENSNLHETELETAPSTVDEKINLSENISLSSDTVILKGEHGDVIINRKKRKKLLNVDKPSSAVKLTSSFLDIDIDEIDKALCEALDAKKAIETPPAGLKRIKDEVLESTTSSTVASLDKVEEAKLKDSEPVNIADLKENILEMASVVIDKLCFLLSDNSTVSSMTGFVQFQTRFVDWQAGALDSKYFVARLKEVEQYFQHYEMSVVSHDWTCQWDRINKRYFYVNSQTQHSQWTYPEEQCDQESSWIQTQSNAESCLSPGPTSVTENNDNSIASSSKIECQDEKQPTLSDKEQSKDASIHPLVAQWLLQSSPPPPPPGVDSPPPPLPPHTPPPSSPPPPPPDTTSALREPEDMDLENSDDSSSLVFIQDKSTDTGNLNYLSVMEELSKKSPVNFAHASDFKPISPSISGCEDTDVMSRYTHTISQSLDNSDLKWSQPSCSSQLVPKVIPVVSVNIHLQPPAEDNCPEIEARLSSRQCSSPSDVSHLKTTKLSNAILKKDKRKSKINPGLGLKKKNIPSLVEKWQKIKDEQEKEDKDSDDSKGPNSL